MVCSFTLFLSVSLTDGDGFKLSSGLRQQVFWSNGFLLPLPIHVQIALHRPHGGSHSNDNPAGFSAFKSGDKQLQSLPGRVGYGGVGNIYDGILIHNPVR